MGWSDKLLEKDPPSWSDSSLTVPKDKAQFVDYTWQLYKGKDEYDENGWIYNTSFDKGGAFGKKGATSVVRSRVWMGHKTQRDAKGNITVSIHTLLQHASGPKALKSPPSRQSPTSAPSFQPTDPDPQASSSSTTSSTRDVIPEDENASIDPTTSELLSTIGEEPPVIATPVVEKSIEPPSSSSGSSYMSLFSSALHAVQEVSAYAYDTAHMATVSVFDAAPSAPPPAASSRSGSSNSTRRFPDLSPAEKQLVSCCANSPSAAPDNAPEPVESPTCTACHTAFGLAKYRYFCGYCANSFCRDHLPATARLHAYGGTKLSKICATCSSLLAQKIETQQRHWRVERVQDFFAGVLAPYVSFTTDTAMDKACRAAEGTLVAAKNVPLGATARLAVVSADFLRKYGRAGLLGFVLRNEFMQSFNTLKELLGDMESLTVQDASLGMYYFMATNRGLRGSSPTLEEDQHTCCPVVSDDLLARMIKFAPITLHCVYELDILDMQRFAKLQGYTLVYASVENRTANQPAFGLVVKPDEKLGILMIRGSKSVQDVLTDLQIASAATTTSTSSSGPLDSFAHHGMAQAATWVKHQVHDSLKELDRQGYRFMINGHSLGGGVAALLSVMLHDEFPSLECFAYAVPACASRDIADACVSYVHSIVLRDDFVPRAKTHNIVKLSAELKDFRDNWTHHVHEDLSAVKSRVVSLWAPRKREWAQQEAARLRGTNVVVQPVASTSTTTSSSGDTTSSSDGSTATAEAWTLNRANLMDQYKETTLPPSSKAADDATGAADEQVEDDDVDLESKDTVELFVPGQITHIYYVHGTYEAVHVRRDCDALSRIQVYENMLADHLGRNYLEALRVVRDARAAATPPPAWVPFDTHTRCQCCESPFTWNSTSSSEAQANVDQHNCRSRGFGQEDGARNASKGSGKCVVDIATPLAMGGLQLIIKMAALSGQRVHTSDVGELPEPAEHAKRGGAVVQVLRHDAIGGVRRLPS
ncbi:hypothetical protein DYB36_005605 [Aphanomyces astaci]|uniref:sn-1-specific diacylglycerol lipase n=1 Tax=Aphanomyces astaci TaxID=112090 RepID=A0A397B5R6_APHAT|nr:hypothetical protein DYB36_005605 [Aphanomyces astaci]